MLMPDEGPLGWLEKGEKAAEVCQDARSLGLIGTVVLLASPPKADPAVAHEAVDAVSKELGGGGGELPDLLARFAQSKGARGKELARKLVGRTLHDLYGLRDHGLTSDDVLHALSFVARSRRTGDARESARALARCGKVAARVVLGHLEEQIAIVHRLQADEVLPSEIDAPLLEFAPRIFAARLPSILKSLLPVEPRVRLAFVLWARLRGIALSKEALVHSLDVLVPEKPAELASAIAARDRRPLLAVAGLRDALALEDAGDLP